MPSVKVPIHRTPHPGVVSDEDFPQNVREALAGAAQLPEAVPGIVAIALVGSWARLSARPDSDVDLVVLTSDPETLLGTSAWFQVFGEDSELVRSEDFGPIQERRLRRPDGLEVELGIGRPHWAATEPPDAGTARVVRDGMRILFDPERLLASLAEALR